MDEKAIGALWLNESQKGQKYMAGVVEIDGVKTKIVVFKNKFKDTDKKPDYKIYKSEPQKQAKPAPQVDDYDDLPF